MKSHEKMNRQLPQDGLRIDATAWVSAPLPSWRMTLFLFGVPILIALSYALWQIHVSRQIFTSHLTEHTQTLAGVIELQARSALMTQEVVDEIVETYLGNMAKFVVYLNAVEPFNAGELTEFSRESGLSGIRIADGEKLVVEGPQGWSRTSGLCADTNGRLKHIEPERLYVYPWKEHGTERCILVGLAASRIEALQSQIGVDYLLSTLSRMPGIRYVRMEPRTADTAPGISIRDLDVMSVAEVRFPLRERVLVVGSGTEYFLVRIGQIWRDFGIFASILLGIGVLLSLILQRHQKNLLHRVRTLDQAIARQQQDAFLGRSAAAIAHEIRNPLNAIDMGLQRLQLESSHLDPDQRSLIQTLREAVLRTNGIVSDLNRFAQPLTAEKAPIRMDRILAESLTLYEPLLTGRHIIVTTRLSCDKPVAGSADLLACAVENLLKNAIEAQPAGGDIVITWKQIEERSGLLSIENGGFTLPEREAPRIIEPYFSRKARGTGLGLPTTVKIVSAHGGNLEVLPVGEGRLRIDVLLPLM